MRGGRVNETYIWFLFIMSIVYAFFAAVYLKLVRANETYRYMWFLIIMSLDNIFVATLYQYWKLVRANETFV
jgi:surface polysaccharide O-acyltransferase-like enzyme